MIDFDNRGFRLGYKFFDRHFNEQQGVLLLAPTGEKFLKSHPGFFRGLCNRSDLMVPFAQGNQSVVYKIDMAEGSYVLKMPKEGFTDIGQPYTNEMRQIQAISRDRGDLLRMFNIGMPAVLMASDKFLLAKFEEGRHTMLSDFDDRQSQDGTEKRLAIFNNIVEGYIEEQNSKNNPLWRDIETDYMDRLSRDFRTTNFIVRNSDRVIIWVDPVMCVADQPKVK